MQRYLKDWESGCYRCPIWESHRNYYFITHVNDSRNALSVGSLNWEYGSGFSFHFLDRPGFLVKSGLFLKVGNTMINSMMGIEYHELRRFDAQSSKANVEEKAIRPLEPITGLGLYQIRWTWNSDSVRSYFPRKLFELISVYQSSWNKVGSFWKKNNYFPSRYLLKNYRLYEFRFREPFCRRAATSIKVVPLHLQR